MNELHKGVRPFACSVCDKNYGRRDYLDRHMKTHDPENQSKRIKLTSNTAGKCKRSEFGLFEEHFTAFVIFYNFP